MTSVFEYDRDAIRVKARFFSPNDQSDTRKFSVDPNLTSYETLRSLLSRAFDLKDDLQESFRISYYCANEWLPMLSDWDLDAAVISASDPCLQLALVKASQREKVTLKGNFKKSQNYPGKFPKIEDVLFVSRHKNWPQFPDFILRQIHLFMYNYPVKCVYICFSVLFFKYLRQ